MSVTYPDGVLVPIPSALIPKEPGSGTVVSRWSRNAFTLNSEGYISAILEQTSQMVFKPDDDSPLVWSPPYPSGSVFMSYAEILALPSADPFFTELWALADAKLAAVNAPPPPPESAPEPTA